MIRINLLPQKRAKRAQANEPGSRDIVVGFAALAVAGAAVFFVVDTPRRSRLHDLADSNERLTQEINAKKAQLQGFDELKKAADEADERVRSINRLMQAKVVPANVLHELSEILTPNHLPTMTEDMTHKTGNGTQSDPNKRFDLAWDPTHVWITLFADNARDGTFKLEGGAAAEVDVTQLSKRLQASAYFDHIAPASEERVFDKDTGISYYKFVITGRVLY